MKQLAAFISYACHPLLMVTYACLLLFFGLTNTIYYVFTPFSTKMVLIGVVFAFTCLLPILNLLILYKLNYISSLKIKHKNERTFPLGITALCYFGLFYMIYDFNVWPAIKLLVLGAALCIFIAAIINIWWQISTHMIGIGGIFGMLYAMSYFMQIPLFLGLTWCLLIAGFIGFSRLMLGAHTSGQVYIGFIFGAVVQFTLFFIAQNIAFI